MKKDSIISLKQEILNQLEQEKRQRGGIFEELLVDPKPERRLAIGYSQVKKGDFRLELRLQKGRGYAYKMAESFKEKALGEANIEVVPRIEIPPLVSLSETRSNKRLRQRERPLHIGLSIGHLDGGAGTLGAFVDSPRGDAILSNNHVLALMGTADLDSPIYQPGRPDLSPLTALHRVALLADLVEISKAERNTVDAAIAVLLDGVEHESNKIPSGLGCSKEGHVLSQIMNFDEIPPQMRVSKIGRTTGYRQGRVTAVAVDGVPVYSSYKGNLIFDNLIEVEWLSSRVPFSLPGDSGSLVFGEDPFRAIGLHFAGGTKEKNGTKTVGVSYACSLTQTLESLDASLLE